MNSTITLLYIAPNPIEMECSNSITTKILAQTRVFEKYFDTYLIGYGVKTITIYHNGNVRYVKGSKADRYSLYSCAKNLIRSIKPNYFYIRYGYCEFGFLSLLSCIKKKGGNGNVMVELPTYPYDKEMWEKGNKYRIFSLFDRMTRNRLKDYVSIFSTFSKDKEILGVETINIMNGIDFSEIKEREYNNMNDCINLIAVSAMGFNHAYERLIVGIHNYYSDCGDRAIVLHMVGEGNELASYKKLVSEYKLEKKVKFYGYLKGESLDQVYNLADIAIASLGMHRANIYVASTLKTREYGAKGLPIVTSCKIDCYDVNWKYLLNVPADETYINIQKVVEFYDSLYKNTKVSTVSEEIRNYAKQVCDINETMKPVVNFFLRQEKPNEKA